MRPKIVRYISILCSTFISLLPEVVERQSPKLATIYLSSNTNENIRLSIARIPFPQLCKYVVCMYVIHTDGLIPLLLVCRIYDDYFINIICCCFRLSHRRATTGQGHNNVEYVSGRIQFNSDYI